jgi:THO complex subunit 1
MQFLILFQYLRSNVKFKTDSQSLDSAQTKCVEEMQGKVYRLLGETPPNGPEFAMSVKRILVREEAWNKWKNDGCPSLAKKMEESTATAPGPRIGEGGSSRKRKRRLGDVVQKELAEKRVNLGNAGLTALWNQNPDNLGACRAKDRDFLPSLQGYFEEAIDQLDPANGIEEDYKKVNNGEWGWRALRLMSRCHFKLAILLFYHISSCPGDPATSSFPATTRSQSCPSTWRPCWGRWPRRCPASGRWRAPTEARTTER